MFGSQGSSIRLHRLLSVVVVALAGAVVVPAIALGASGVLSTSTQAMEGDLKVPQGSTLWAGYDFTMPGSHPAAMVAFTATAVTFDATCATGTPGSQTITVGIPDESYIDAADSSAWYPSGDQKSPLTYQGSTTVPTFCDPGVLVSLRQGGALSTYVTSTDTTDPVHVRWHYVVGTFGSSWSGTYSVIPAGSGGMPQ